MPARYAAEPAHWDRVVAAVRAAGSCGWDTETFGHDVRESGPAHRARVHVWSIAVLTGRLHPRGYREAAGVTLPAGALLYGPIRDLLADPGVPKYAHNAPHDWHAATNAGAVVAGLVDTLPRARLAYPGLPGHGLKNLSRTILGKEVTEYRDVLSEPNVIQLRRRRRVTRCVRSDGSPCPYEGCRRRSGHKREIEIQEYTETLTRGTREIPLETVVPGHERWEALVAYAAQDAERAAELEDHMERNNRTWRCPVPWEPAGGARTEVAA